MTRKSLFALLITGFLVSCKQAEKPDNRAKKFTIDYRLKTTPVKNQGRSSLCWAYAMLATIETEHLMQGDSVNLSTDYVARMYLREQAMQRIYQPRKFVKKLPPITTRGTASMLIDLIQTYGLQHYDAFHSEPNTGYDMIARALTQMTTGVLASSDSLVDDFLDRHTAFLPKQVFMYGILYSPQEFARSVCKEGEYTAITSFIHHPFGEKFPLEVPDNYYHNTFVNVPLDSMQSMIVNSIKKGHPVCWEGDISNSGFNWADGYADVETSQLPITVEKRQKAFANYDTTDDHCMEIIGLAHDGTGKKYFLCKNSWGKNNRYSGFMFLSYDYVKLRTIALMVKL